MKQGCFSDNSKEKIPNENGKKYCPGGELNLSSLILG
jgi:hypothetical protein